MRKAKVTYYFRESTRVPMLRLRGKWLSQAGFDQGVEVTITVEAGRLTLALVPRAPESG